MNIKGLNKGPYLRVEFDKQADLINLSHCEPDSNSPTFTVSLDHDRAWKLLKWLYNPTPSIVLAIHRTHSVDIVIQDTISCYLDTSTNSYPVVTLVGNIGKLQKTSVVGLGDFKISLDYVYRLFSNQ